MPAEQLIPDARPGPCRARGPVTKHAAAHLLEIADEDLVRCAAALRGAVVRGAHIYTFGNGGSASTASHLACDLWHGRPELAGRRARAQCLHDLSMTTALANDAGFEEIFVAPLRNLLDEQDVLVGISVSGRSPNVVRALALGWQRGVTTVALLGGDGGVAKSFSDVSVTVPCNDPGVVESAHLAIVHDLAVRVYQDNSACR